MDDSSERNSLGQFKVGHSGTGGRPVGARSKLGEAFLQDLQDAWTKRGPQVIEAAIADDPCGVLKIVANLLPKQKQIEGNIDVSVFHNVATFAQAFQIATEAIGATTAPKVSKRKLLQLEAEMTDDDEEPA